MWCSVDKRDVSPPCSDYLYVKKAVTKEKESNWLWRRPSRSSSVSSASTSPRRRHHRKHHKREESDCCHHRGRSPEVHHSDYRRRRSGERSPIVHHYHHRRHQDHRHYRRQSEKRSPIVRRRPSPRPSRPQNALIHHQSTQLDELQIPRQHKHSSKPSFPALLITSPLIPVRIVSEYTPQHKDRRRNKMRMEEVAAFTYDNWRKRETACVAEETVAQESVSPKSVAQESVAPKSSVSARTTKSGESMKTQGDSTYQYIPMREPGPQDAVPVAYALYPQPGYTYLYPGQQLPQGYSPMMAPAPVAISKPEEPTYHNYTTERRDKAVATVQPPEPQQMTFAYPQGWPTATAIPVAFAMPNYPVPKHSTLVTSDPDPSKRVWVGRTKKQVDEDNAKIAHKEGVYNPNEIMPKGAAHDQLFWVIEPDGTNTLRTFRTIEEDLQPGKWKVDPRYGNAYFVRDKECKK